MPREGLRSRSRSPQHRDKQHKRRRSRSHSRDRKQQHSSASKPLPFNARDLTKHDLHQYRSMFALYLDIQKQQDIDDMEEDEVKGRWKSFIKKWNRGELAEGWYDPTTLEKAIKSDAEPRHHQASSKPAKMQQSPDGNGSADESDGEYGPTLPSTHQHVSSASSAMSRSAGPVIPSVSDLQARHEQDTEDATQERQNQLDDVRAERRQDRRLQKERLDEIVPRAEAGTRERQLEKKREKADANRSFAATKEGGGDVDLRDADIMGDPDSLGELKRMKKENERKKNDREIRKEEFLRARRAEREARMAGLKAKEDKTVEMLKEIAKARFGDGGVD